VVKKKKNVPALRFPGFEEEWENNKLVNIIHKFESGVSVNSVDEPVVNNTDYGILKTSCVSSGIFFPNENKKIVPEEIKRARLNPIKYSIIISRMNTPQLVGEIGYVSNNYPHLFLPDRLWLISINDEKYDSYLLSQLLSSFKVKVKIKNTATGTSGSMKNISKDKLLNITISLPTLPEQQKIASFLTAVDERIRQLTRKKELLEKYKKGVMQKIFSRKISFKDDKGNNYPDWKYEKIGKYLKEFVERVSSLTEIPVLTSSREGLIMQKAYFANRKVQNAGNYGVVPRGYFTYRHMSDDSTFKFNINNLCDKGAISKEYPVFTTDNMDSEFLRIKLNSGIEFKKFAVAQKLGGTRVRLYFNVLKECPMMVPSLPEQQKISSIHIAINKTIEHVNTQLEKTISWKKGLLQKMFV